MIERFKISYLFFLAALFCNVQIQAQETPQPEFPIGAFLSGDPGQGVLASFDTSGLNTVTWKANSNTSSFLEDYKVWANNSGWTDWIQYYATCYYSRWEGEQDATIDHIGVKHEFGKDTTWQNTECWSSSGLSAPACSLMYGPHYRQDMRYKSYYHTGYIWGVDYVPRFNLALDNPYSLDSTRNICVLKVVYRYAEIDTSIPPPNNYEVKDTTFLQDTLKISDFPKDSSFKIFNVWQNDTNYYRYPDKFKSAITGDRVTMSPTFPDTTAPIENGFIYSDRNADNGIQFFVDYLGNDSTTLFIDFAEVYDNNGWNEYIDPSTYDSVIAKIQTYAESYSGPEWNNIIYWYGQDEPYSQDSFTPIRIVDSLVQHFGGAPVTQYFQPDWRILVNGDTFMVDYYRKAKPPELIIDPYPFGHNYYPVRVEDLESLRQEFQIASSLKPGFWFIGQGFGEEENGEPYIWRQPDPEELLASIMLALAHGVKGLMFWNYDSYSSTGGIYVIGIVDENGVASDLWFLIHDNFVPRLNGKLGKTLLSLDYTGNFLQLQYSSPTQNPIPDPVTYDYLTLGLNPVADDMNWHAGFLIDSSDTDNKHFLLANLWTSSSRTIQVRVTEPVPGYINYRFRNVEPGYNFDYTFNDEMVATLDHPAGEGYLYQVAPVVKYGGRLIYNETVAGDTLRDDMIIENGTILTVNGTYTAKANIIVKDGSIINVQSGEIHFEDGMKLIIEGTATINGTLGDKLMLAFEGPETQNGIVIDPAGSLTISNCIIEGAETGIKAELYAKYLNAQYVDFVDCITSSVTILGQMGGGETPPPQVKYCTISNSEYGISVSNLSTITMQQNTITNTELGIFLSNVTGAIVYVNTINSNKESMPGILSESSGGDIVANTITGHTNGIHLGNSSPDIGDNEITSNKYHGIYIGSGSYPNMRGELAGNPPHMYPISGYNWVYENGGYIIIGAPPDNDGSEIYFKYSDALMREGCNSIIDDRTPGGGLVNTLLLMNGDGNEPMEIHAELNFWGDTVYAARFGALTVYFNPYYYDHCPIPQGGGGEEGLVMKNSGGEVIDTIYSVPANIPQLTETELKYSEAEEYFVTADYPSAEVLYQEIINSQATEEEKHKAQIRKYEIGKLTNQSPEFFNTMGNTFESIGANAADSLTKKIFSQLSTLCLIGEEEYIPAISEFDIIVQQNPGSEESVYAEIDALTAALLLPPDSSLGKGSLGKYLIKNSGDYLSKLDGILRKNFGSEKETAEKEILPEEYTLYQNYPNPFNPVTTIKYDLPKAGEVELVIYDILGRRVKTLVNQTQQAGRYDIQFDASSLASGVYIYQLRAKDFVNSKKMIFLK